MLESIASGSNTSAALVAMSRWAAHRRLLRSPGGGGEGWRGGRGGGGESLSPLFDSAALPAVFERLLMMASSVATMKAAVGAAAAAAAAAATGMATRCGGGARGLRGDQPQPQQQQGQGGGAVVEDGCLSEEEDLLEEAKTGLEELLRWALPDLDGSAPGTDADAGKSILSASAAGRYCWELVSSVRRLCSHGGGVPLSSVAARMLSQKLVEELRTHREAAFRLKETAAIAAGMSAAAAKASAKCNSSGGGGTSGKRGLAMEELLRQRWVR
ncbi:unnamed protein product, partial [Hapterophycus canaliculatus]